MYLSDTWIIGLPKSLSNLHNLQILKLGCYVISKLLDGLGNIMNLNLRYLDTMQTPPKDMLKGINKLKISIFLKWLVIGRDQGAKIEALWKRPNLHNTTWISILENIATCSEAFEVRSMEYNNIYYLYFQWSLDSYHFVNSWKKIVDNMTNLNLNSYLICCMLPSLRQLSSLKRQNIERFDGLETTAINIKMILLWPYPFHL